MTESALADAYYSVSYISAVERGQIRPSRASLEHLAARLDVLVTDLVGDDARS